MKMSFSTLACPTWTLSQVTKTAVSSGYDGIELRFLEGEDSLWKLPAFQGSELAVSKRMISDNGLVIACVGTSCRFHSPDRSERERWVEEGKRMAELVAALDSAGIRVFGDKVQPGADRDSTRNWIAEGVRFLAELTKDDGVIDWSWPAVRVHNLIRGLHPWPHAFSFLHGRRLILIRSRAVAAGPDALVRDASEAATGPPGTIVEASGERLVVATGAGSLQLLQIQTEGKRPMSAREFLAGHRLTAGDRFTVPP